MRAIGRAQLDGDFRLPSRAAIGHMDERLFASTARFIGSPISTPHARSGEQYTYWAEIGLIYLEADTAAYE